MTSTDGVGLGAVAVLILLAAVMAAAEVVITRTSRVRAHRLLEEHRRGATSLVIDHAWCISCHVRFEGLRCGCGGCSRRSWRCRWGSRSAEIW